ncbi:MAG: transglutaminase domain-containing protein [Spirochaetales bacterium]|nr:transglutaminase domain-containing protein [Spirochaetales bacterium]
MKLKAFLVLFLGICSLNLPAQELKLKSIELGLPEQIKLEEELWYRIFFLDQEVGYYFTQVFESTWEDQVVFAQYTEVYISIERFSQKLENRTVIINILSAELKPVCIIYQQYVSFQEPVFKQCEIKQSTLELTEIIQGKTEKTTIDLPENFATDLQIVLQMLKAGLKPGWEKSYIGYDISTGDFNENKVEVIGKKQVDFKGGERMVSEIRTVNKTQGLTLDTYDWLDMYGNLLYSHEKTTGLIMEQSPKDHILNNQTALDLDSFSIHVQKQIVRPEKVGFLKLKITLEGDDKEMPFIEHERQRYAFHGGEQYMEITGLPFSEEESVMLPLSSVEEYKEYLSSNKYIQADNEDIKSLAADIAGREKNAWRACKKIARWLQNNIKPSYRMSFLSAQEVLEKREGDCTEFAVLFAALARASGIPARINIGLVYYDNQFVFHAWNEVFVGQWVAIDAALYQFEVDATHLIIYSGDLAHTNELYVKMICIMGKMKLEIVEYR